MSTLRLRGLVKAMNEVRHRLAAGIPDAQAADFRRQVLGVVADVESLCRQHRITPGQLPAPSYRAYTFLKTLDLQHLPDAREGAPAPNRQFRIKNLVAFCNGLQGELEDLARAGMPGRGEKKKHSQASVLAKIQSQVEAVDILVAQADTSPSALPVRTRRAYQWLKFLSEPANLEVHLTQLAALQALAAEARKQRAKPALHRQKFAFELYHTAHLYRVQQQGKHTRVVVNEGFLGAPRAVLTALARVTCGLGTKADVHRVKAYADTDDFAEIVQSLEVPDIQSNGFTQGRTYNLETVFARVNARYFRGRTPQPRLTWNATLSSRKFGHYLPAADTVMISITLDDPQVPAYVIDFVMYHELLHKTLGMQISKGRRYAHTRAFREKEKQFQEYEKAMEYLKGTLAK